MLELSQSVRGRRRERTDDQKKDNAQKAGWKEELKQLLMEDEDLLKMLVEQTVQQVLDVEMDEALQAGKGERTTGRLGYRSGYYSAP